MILCFVVAVEIEVEVLACLTLPRTYVRILSIADAACAVGPSDDLFSILSLRMAVLAVIEAATRSISPFAYASHKCLT